MSAAENSPPRSAALQAVIEDVGGGTKLAQLCGVSPSAVSHWRDLPLHHVAKVADATKRPRHVLRPDRPDLFPPPAKEAP